MARGLRSALALAILMLAVGISPLPGAAQDPGTPAPAAPPAEGATSQAGALMKTERFKRLAGELRCLVCQNQSLVDSNAPLAQDLREEVVKLMASGRDDGQIKSFLVDRYGEFVLYRPALSLRNALLWFGPFLLLLVGVVAWWRLGRRKPQPAQSAQDALKHVDELLGQ
jgi:cytochrome c-type biogenesis protein CcmH